MNKIIKTTILSITFSCVFACTGSQTDNAASNASQNNSSITAQSNGFSTVSDQNNRQNVPVRTTIDEIYAAAAANDKSRFAEICSGKPIIITGLFDLLKNDKNEQIVTLKSADSDKTLNAYVRSSESDGVSKMSKGQYVIAEGRCETQAESFVIKNSRVALFNVPPNQVEEKTNVNREKI